MDRDEINDLGFQPRRPNWARPYDPTRFEAGPRDEEEDDEPEYDEDGYGADDEDDFEERLEQIAEPESDGRLCVAIILMAATVSALGVLFGVGLAVLS